MTACDHCAYMASVGLPDHYTELLALANDDAYRLDVDSHRLRDSVWAELEVIGHDPLRFAFGYRAIVRKHALILAGHEGAGIREVEAR